MSSLLSYFVGNENAPVNIEGNEQESASPQKVAAASPGTKAVLTPSTEAESPDAALSPTPETEVEAHKVGEVSEETEVAPIAWEADIKSALRPVAEPEADLKSTLPCIGEALDRNPVPQISWIAAAISVEAMEAEHDLAVMSEFPKVSQPSWLYQSAMPNVAQPSILLRSPKYDVGTRTAALTKLSRADNDDGSDVEEEIERQASLSRLEKQCAIAAQENVKQELQKTRWRDMLSKSFDDDTLELLCEGLADSARGNISTI